MLGPTAPQEVAGWRRTLHLWRPRASGASEVDDSENDWPREEVEEDQWRKMNSMVVVAGAERHWSEVAIVAAERRSTSPDPNLTIALNFWIQISPLQNSA